MSTQTSPALTARRWLLLGAVPLALVFAPPILAIGTPQDIQIPVIHERSTPAPAHFSHWRHNAQHCYACHPSVFPQAMAGFTHEQMQSGLYCGSCHDGQGAKSLTSMRCEVCHVSH